MTRASFHDFAIGLFSILGMAACLVPPLAPLRPYLTLPLVMLLPGLAVARLLLGSRASSFELLVISSGLSLAIAVALGLLLNIAGAMTPLGWSVSLGSVTLVACGARLLVNPTPGSPPDHDRKASPVSVAQASLFAIASLITVLAIAVAREGAMSQREYSFTEFWMATRKPVDQNIVTIGVHNEEKAPTSYQVVMVADGAMIGRWPRLRLDAGATWTTEISLNADLRRSQRVEAWLYRGDKPDEVYRKVWLVSSAN